MDGYPAAVKYLESLLNYERLIRYPYKRSVGLKRIKNLLQSIGNPHRELKVIHVAGSKGKGSTCAFIAYILRQAGFSVGLYTSPHLSDLRERIRVLGPVQSSPREQFEGMISRKEFVKLVEFLKPEIKKSGTLSFFEACTALAFLYFNKKNVDFAVLETGLGGRLDATNVANSLVSVITPISYEHTMYLGKTLARIAGEKAGIIKRGSVIVCSPQSKEAGRVIEARAGKMKAGLLRVGREIRYSAEGKSFSIKGVNNNYSSLSIRLLGDHQLVNASLAVGAVEALSRYGYKVGIDSVRRGLYNTVWPGRMEVLCRKPLIVIDGAQNAASAAVLKSAVRNIFRYRELILVFGVSQDKDIGGISAHLSRFAHKVVLTKADNPRAAAPEYLRGYFPQKEGNLFVTGGTREAMSKAAQIARKGDLILVTGSLFVVGEFRDAYRRY
ncbi:MAG: bifunctional folylpolyglutamate synthase/dihydrofolate synthase [Candidatus Omnitrophica bacterium]|nr:bifunctional folylpolyglutamate synthase/dihydrofolate synthase [Candidatus Omnitrophota bacterium]MDD5771556.1 bifunctional folylpolyglutamate synthase/dihydrofolate synthase [Candidatus Omnitrophota bacterium]